MQLFYLWQAWVMLVLLLGPLTNPAGAKNQVMGVFQCNLTTKLAQVLQQLGSQHVLVVHGADGMDEISISGATYIAEFKNGKIKDKSMNAYKLSTLKFIVVILGILILATTLTHGLTHDGRNLV